MVIPADPYNQSGEYRWEDVVIGETALSKPRTVTEEEIMAFASQYDPLPIHVDKVAAAASQFGGIIAAGSHMLALKQIHLRDFAYPAGVIVSMGHDEVRFLKPLRGGAKLQVAMEFLDKRPTSKPDRGVVTIGLTLLADDVAVLSLKEIVLIKRRNGQA